MGRLKKSGSIMAGSMKNVGKQAFEAALRSGTSGNIDSSPSKSDGGPEGKEEE